MAKTKQENTVKRFADYSHKIRGQALEYARREHGLNSWEPSFDVNNPVILAACGCYANGITPLPRPDQSPVGRPHVRDETTAHNRGPQRRVPLVWPK